MSINEEIFRLYKKSAMDMNEIEAHLNDAKKKLEDALIISDYYLKKLEELNTKCMSSRFRYIVKYIASEEKLDECRISYENSRKTVEQYKLIIKNLKDMKKQSLEVRDEINQIIPKVQDI